MGNRRGQAHLYLARTSHAPAVLHLELVGRGSAAIVLPCLRMLERGLLDCDRVVTIVQMDRSRGASLLVLPQVARWMLAHRRKMDRILIVEAHGLALAAVRTVQRLSRHDTLCCYRSSAAFEAACHASRAPDLKVRDRGLYFPTYPRPRARTPHTMRTPLGTHRAKRSHGLGGSKQGRQHTPAPNISPGGASTHRPPGFYGTATRRQHTLPTRLLSPRACVCVCVCVAARFAVRPVAREGAAQRSRAALVEPRPRVVGVGGECGLDESGERGRGDGREALERTREAEERRAEQSARRR